MSKLSLAIVCVIALMLGGAAGLMLNRRPQSNADVKGAEEKNIPVEKNTGVAVEPTPISDAVAEPSAASVPATESSENAFAPESSETVPESSENVPDEAVATSDNPGKVLNGAARKTRTNREAATSARPARSGYASARPARGGYARGTSRPEGDGGRSVASHTVRGLKKTGRAISKPFKKLGGVFRN